MFVNVCETHCIINTTTLLQTLTKYQRIIGLSFFRNCYSRFATETKRFCFKTAIDLVALFCNVFAAFPNEMPLRRILLQRIKIQTIEMLSFPI